MNRLLNKMGFVFNCLLFLMSFHVKTEYPAVELRGTYSVLKREYKNLSPLIGFVWYNGDITEDYYFGDSNDATIQLVRKMFHVIEEHGEFTITNQRTNIVRYFTPATIGIVLATLEKEDFLAASNEQKVEQLVSALSNDLSSFKKILDTKEYNSLKKSEIAKLKIAIEPGIKREKYVTFLTETPEGQKLLETKPYKDDIRAIEIQDQQEQKGAAAIPVDEIENWVTRLGKKQKLPIQAQINKTAANLLENSGNEYIKRHLESFVLLLVNALQEKEDGKQGLFTLNNILLTYLYAIANDRAALKSYFDEFPRSYFKEGEEFLVESEPFSKETYEQTKAERYEWLATEDDFPRVFFDDEQYEKAVFAGQMDSVYERGFGSMADDIGTSTYNFSNNKSVIFANCVETTIRNIINLLVSNPKEIEFDLSLLENSGLSVKEQTQDRTTLLNIKDFYEKFNTVESVKLNEAHNEWNKVVSDIPGVGYKFGPNGVRSDINYHDLQRDDNIGFCEIVSNIPHTITIFRYLLHMPEFEQYLADRKISINRENIFVDEKKATEDDVKKIFETLFKQFSRDNLTFELKTFRIENRMYGVIEFMVTDNVANGWYLFKWRIGKGHSQIDLIDGSQEAIGWVKEVRDILVKQIENLNQTGKLFPSNANESKMLVVPEILYNLSNAYMQGADKDFKKQTSKP